MKENLDNDLFNGQSFSGRLTPEDIAFVHRAFGDEMISLEDMYIVLDDLNLRQPILDNYRFFENLQKENDQLCISEYFYYYIQVRQVLLKAGLKDLKYTEYVAISLVDMATLHRQRMVDQGEVTPSYIPVDMNVIIENVGERKKIALRAKVGTAKMDIEGFLGQ